MKIFLKFFTWWTICGPNDGIKGESMNPMTFGNMTHPNMYIIWRYCLYFQYACNSILNSVDRNTYILADARLRSIQVTGRQVKIPGDGNI